MGLILTKTNEGNFSTVWYAQVISVKHNILFHITTLPMVIMFINKNHISLHFRNTTRRSKHIFQTAIE